MSDMGSVPKVPTLRHVLDIFGKIIAVDPNASNEIAATILRVANKNRILEDRCLNDSHLERMAFFLKGATNISSLKSLFASTAFTGKKMRQEDIDEMMEAIDRYLLRHPAVERNAGFTGMEKKLLVNRSVYIAYHC